MPKNGHSPGSCVWPILNKLQLLTSCDIKCIQPPGHQFCSHNSLLIPSLNIFIFNLFYYFYSLVLLFYLRHQIYPTHLLPPFSSRAKILWSGLGWETLPKVIQLVYYWISNYSKTNISQPTPMRWFCFLSEELSVCFC